MVYKVNEKGRGWGSFLVVMLILIVSQTQQLTGGKINQSDYVIIIGDPCIILPKHLNIVFIQGLLLKVPE